MSARPRIGIIVGSTRPVRVGRPVADELVGMVEAAGATPVMLDLAEIRLPLLDEPLHPASGIRSHAHSIAWAEQVAGLNGVLFLTPEYNAGYPAPLKNAIDYLKAEWAEMPAAVISYGSRGGPTAAAQLAAVLERVGVALQGEGVQMAFERTDFDESMRMLDAPAFVARSREALQASIEQVVAAAADELVSA